MIIKVLKKQYNSDMCFVCGVSNQFGLHTNFYELENKAVIGLFKGQDIHQSYPKRMHGGIVAAMLDETIGRAIQTYDDLTWGVTIEFQIRYYKPVPLDQELKVVGKITSNRSKIFEGEGYICDQDNQILARSTGRYLKQKVDKIVDDIDFIEEKWIFLDDHLMPESFDLPE
jgi:acyl-coenzyme A thioesterase PaaI-like protein